MSDFIPWDQFSQPGHLPTSMSPGDVHHIAEAVIKCLPGHPLLGMISGKGFDEAFVAVMDQLRSGAVNGGSLFLKLTNGTLRLDLPLCQGHVLSTGFDLEAGTGLKVEMTPLESYVQYQLSARGEKLLPHTPVWWSPLHLYANAAQLGLVEAMRPLVAQALSQMEAEKMERAVPECQARMVRRGL